jgi:hypothetical protein
MVSKKDFVVVILLLVVVVGLAFNRYYPNQSNANPPQPGLTFIPQSTLTPLPEFDQPSDSPITIQSSTPSDSGQPTSNLKLGIYVDDPSKSQPRTLQSIDWSADGPLEQGLSRNSSQVYFTNEGNVPITLFLSTSDWAFQDITGKALAQSCQQYFTLTWNYDNSTIAVGETKPITFTLAISPNMTNVASFSFSLVVTTVY